MAQLIVREISKEVVGRLKELAASHGRSAEAEHREILKRVLLGPSAPPLKSLLVEMPNLGRDADFHRPRRLGRRVKL